MNFKSIIIASVLLLSTCAVAPVTAQQKTCYTLADFFAGAAMKGASSPITMTEGEMLSFIRTYNNTPPLEQRIESDEVDQINWSIEPVSGGRQLAVVMFFKGGCGTVYVYMPLDLLYNMMGRPS